MVYNYNKQYDYDLFNSIINSLKKQKSLAPEKVIYNDPATIIFWNDGTKTVVKAHDGDQYDPVVGFLLAVMKRFYGNKSDYNDILRKAGCFEKKAEMMEHEVYVPIDIFKAFKNSFKNAIEATKNIGDRMKAEIRPDKIEAAKNILGTSTIEIRPLNVALISSPDNQEKVEKLKEQRTKLESDIDKLDPWEERMAQIGANDILKNKAEKVESSKPLGQVTGMGYIPHANPRFPGFEKWLAEHNMSYNDFDRFLNKKARYTSRHINDRKRNLSKEQIDEILAATGLTFEQCFMSK